MAVTITERGVRDSCLGPAIQLKIFAEDYRLLSWREVWDAFVTKYPNRWAVQVFPPEDRLVDAKAVYHLFMLQDEPMGLDIK